MFLELRRSGPLAPTCEACGATELMYQGDLPLRLDLLDVTKDYPWWRPLSRKRELAWRERIINAWEPVVYLTRLPLRSENDQQTEVDRS